MSGLRINVKSFRKRLELSRFLTRTLRLQVAIHMVLMETMMVLVAIQPWRNGGLFSDALTPEPEPPEEPYQCSDEPRFPGGLSECEYDEREQRQEEEFDDCGPQRSEEFKREIGCPGFEEEQKESDEEPEEEEPEEEEEQDDPGTAWDETCRSTDEVMCLH